MNVFFTLQKSFSATAPISFISISKAPSSDMITSKNMKLYYLWFFYLLTLSIFSPVGINSNTPVFRCPSLNYCCLYYLSQKAYEIFYSVNISWCTGAIPVLLFLLCLVFPLTSYISPVLTVFLSLIFICSAY